jgi:hypothetical protein
MSGDDAMPCENSSRHALAKPLAIEGVIPWVPVSGFRDQQVDHLTSFGFDGGWVDFDSDGHRHRRMSPGMKKTNKPWVDNRPNALQFRLTCFLLAAVPPL